LPINSGFYGSAASLPLSIGGVLHAWLPHPLAGLQLLILALAFQTATLLAVETFGRQGAIFGVVYRKYADGYEPYDANEKIQTIFRNK